jgi:hypothetical protein
MKSIFAVIIDKDGNYLVGKRYDTDQALFLLGGTYEDNKKENEAMNILMDKVYEKSSLVIRLDKISEDVYEMSDGKNVFTLNKIYTYKDGKYVFFYTDDHSFSDYLNDWREQFQENQIRIVDFVVKKLRKDLGYFISYVDWLNLIVMYKNRYRVSNSLKNILDKRGLTNQQISYAIDYLELLDIFIRYQNLSLVTVNQMKDRNGLTDSQRDVLDYLPN